MGLGGKPATIDNIHGVDHAVPAFLCNACDETMNPPVGGLNGYRRFRNRSSRSMASLRLASELA